MRKIVLITLMFLALTADLHASNIYGAVRGTLSKANSPYTVTTDLLVLPGDTLLIESGVVLNFNRDVAFKIQGKIKILGSPADSVYFGANQSEQIPGFWKGIYLDGASNSSVVQFTKISGAAVGIIISQCGPIVQNSLFEKNLNAIDCKQQASPEIKFNTIKRNSNSGIRILNSSPYVWRNQFYFNCDSEVESAVVYNTGAGGRLQRNIIAFNSLSGVDCQGGSAPEIVHNTIVGNYYGITVQGSTPTICGNVIYQNENGLMVEDTCGAVSYNDIYGNSSMDLYNPPQGVGIYVTVNVNGDSVDQFNNLFLNPALANVFALKFYPISSSPLIDAGDPANPAGIIFLGSAPDIGALEFSESLPVEISNFWYEQGALYWITASENQNYGFKIWVADNPLMNDKEQIGFVKGHGTSWIPQSYSFPIKDLTSGIYYFQLEQIDLSGESKYSTILKVSHSGSNSESKPFASQPYPNPFNGDVRFSWQIENDEIVSLKIFNALGQQVAEPLLPTRFLPGQHGITWNGRNDFGKKISSGIYYGILKIGRYRYRFPLLHVR